MNSNNPNPNQTEIPNQGQHSANDKYALQFPEMKKIKKAPSLATVNGIGLSMAGSRDNDQNTGTYIKTRVFTLLFIPILALGAYRVANSQEGGWHFLGKEKLSGFAKAWNYIFMIGIVAGISWFFYNSHISSDDYKAEQAIAKAEQQVTAGDTSAALASYMQAYSYNSKHRKSIFDGFSLAANKGLESSQLETVAETTQLLITSPLWGELEDSYPNLYLDSIEKANIDIDNPQAALKLIQHVRRLAGADTKWVSVKLQKLEALAASQSPVDLKVAEELTKMYNEIGESGKIITLLSPIKDSLKDRLAAKTLGSAYLAHGQSAEAIPLLEAYLLPRQTVWTEAANKIDATYEKEYQKIIDKIQNGYAPESIYNKLEQAKTDTEKQEVVYAYVERLLKKGGDYSRYNKILEKDSEVPAAIMDLGIAHLRVAQSAPTKRAYHLEKAESTLLSMQNYAGDSPGYKLFLGQVYYWLGKPTEGKDQFDSLINSPANNFGILMSISNTLRDVGRIDEALELSEKAYNKGLTTAEKSEAASLRAILSDDVETSIEWFEKADQSDPNVIINLNSEKANLAIQNNEVDKAISLYKKALIGYSKQPRGSTSLNNAALIHFAMFKVSGETSHYNDGLHKIDQAIKLSPNSSTLCINAAGFFFNATAQDLLKDKMEPKLIQQGVSIADVVATINSPEELDAISEVVKAHPNYKKACQFLERAMLLAPQSTQVYTTGVGTYGSVSDLPRLKQLMQKMKASKVDTSSFETTWKEGLDDINHDSIKEDFNRAQVHLNTTYDSLKTESGKQLTRSRILQLGFSTWHYIPITDIDDRIKELRSIKQQQPNSVTSGALNEALITKACIDLSKKNPEFLEWVKQSKYQLGNRLLLLLWLDHLDDPSATINQLPSIKVALTEEHQRNLKFPGHMSISDWVIAKLIAPESASEVASNINTKESVKLTTDFSLRFSSYHPASKLLQTWALMAEGKTDEAKAFYNSAQKTTELLPKAY